MSHELHGPLAGLPHAIPGRMSRSHCAVMLLAHGPLTEGQFVEITGWRFSVADTVLRKLCARGRLKKFSQRGTGRYLFGLA